MIFLLHRIISLLTTINGSVSRPRYCPLRKESIQFRLAVFVVEDFPSRLLCYLFLMFVEFGKNAFAGFLFDCFTLMFVTPFPELSPGSGYKPSECGLWIFREGVSHEFLLCFIFNHVLNFLHQPVCSGPQEYPLGQKPQLMRRRDIHPSHRLFRLSVSQNVLCQRF